MNSDLAGLWVNLGVLYARHGKYEHAEAAYLRALELDGKEPSALANLALVYQALGKSKLAAEYGERVQGYRERNPYYHFASATRAYEQQQFEAALASVRKALRIKPDEHEFYTLRGPRANGARRSRATRSSASSARANIRKPRRGARKRSSSSAVWHCAKVPELHPQSCASRRRNFCTRWPVLTSVVYTLPCESTATLCTT